MSSTKNVKGNRQIVVTTYTREGVFKIPDGLDLEDKTVVADWRTNCEKLCIRYVNSDKELEIEPEWEDDYVHTEVEIKDAVDKGVEYDQDNEK